MSKTIEIDDVYTPEEVAKALKVAGGTIRNLIKKGSLFAYQVGDQYRIPRYALDQWLSPFASVEWEAIGFGVLKGDKETKDPAQYVRKLRKTKHQSVKEYLTELEQDPPL